MSILVPINGSNYIIPTPNEVGWGTNLDNFFVAISAGCLQKTGGNFTLSAETDFGGAFGLKSLYYKSRTSNVADSGIFRLANNGDSVAWRNAANSGNNLLAVNTSDQLTYNGVAVAVGGSGTVLPGTANTLAYYPASTNTVDDLPAITATQALVSNSNGLPVASVTTTSELAGLHGLTASRAVQTDGSGILATSVTTSAELAFVSGVTSAIQTQLNAKATDSLVVHLSGTETITGVKNFTANPTLTATGNTFWLINATASGGVPFIQLKNSSPVTNEIGTENNLGGVSGRYGAPASSLNLFTPTTVPIVLSTNGTPALTVSASQQVDIGNTKQTVAGNQVLPVVQIVSTSNTSSNSLNTSTYTDSNLTVSITPKFSTSKIYIVVTGTLSANSCTGSATLARNGTNLLTSTGFASVTATTPTIQNATSFNYYDSPASTSAQTYSVQIKTSNGTGIVDWNSPTQYTTTITVIEYAQ